MGSKTFGNKPDIRVKLFFSEIKPNEEEEAKKPKDDSVELLFGECSKLDAERPKHIRDWKKLLRSCKDGHKRLFNVVFEGKDKACPLAVKMIYFV